MIHNSEVEGCIGIGSHWVPQDPTQISREQADARSNRIGQWLNEASNGTLLQLSYKLNSEAPVGTYRIQVWNVDNNLQFSQSFKVEKYGKFFSSHNIDVVWYCHV
ncbi:hypothetical protein N1851_005662 [Merluccius polli]|uniref:Uncharacterized protein n=1 Tax=Merluccius polli TaxID=89951 RepID=A0AA47P921_MERPO|nr:hypothetical protein N1851_005662 [Merluccius polli]